MKKKMQRVLAGAMTAAMFVSSTFTPGLALPVGAEEVPGQDLYLQSEGWIVKKGDTETEEAATALATIGGTEWSELKAVDANGNGHFGGGAPEAFLLTEDDTITDGDFHFNFRLGSERLSTRFRFVTKYLDDSNWSYIGYDTSGGWYYQFKVDGSENWPSISGLPTVEMGDVVTVDGVWHTAEDGKSLELSVDNTTTGESGTATLEDATFTSLAGMAGKVGFGAGKYQSQYTDILFKDVEIGEGAYTGGFALYGNGDYQESVVFGGSTVRQLVASETITNAKAGKAFISKAAYDGVTGTAAGTYVTTVTNKTAEGATAKFAALVRYTDSNNWAAVGFDGKDWYYQVVNGSGVNTVKKLANITAPFAAGDTATICVEYGADAVTAIAINDVAAEFEAIDGFAALPTGTIGYLLSTSTALDVTRMDFTEVAPEPTASPEPTKVPDPEPQNGKKWYVITSNGGGGHNYGNGGVAAPALALDNTGGRTMPLDGKMTVTLRSVTGNNIGVFYTYLNDSNWLYVGYDNSSGWYYQFNKAGSGSYPALSGLPDFIPGEEYEITVGLSHETLEVTVNGTTVYAPNQKLYDLAEAIDGQGRFGVKTNGASVLEFTDVKLGNANCMDDTWGLCATRAGQTLTTHYTAVYDVSGTVKDPDGKPVEDATVQVGIKKTNTDENGAFLLTEVENGSYTLAVSKIGYQALTQPLDLNSGSVTGLDLTLSPKQDIDLDSFDTIKTDEMTAYVGKDFPYVARYVMADGSFFRGQEDVINAVEINGVTIVPTVTTTDAAGAASKSYDLSVADEDSGINLTMTVELSVAGNALTWQVTSLKKGEGCPAIATINVPQLNLLSVSTMDTGSVFDGASKSTTTTSFGDSSITFEDGFAPNQSGAYLYAFLTNGKLSAGLWSNSEAEGDKRVTRTNGADTMALNSSPWYYEKGDANGQKTDYIYITSDLPCAKVAIAADENADGQIDWNDGALAYRSIMNYAQGSENIPEMVNYRIVMNFASMAPQNYLKTADNVKKVYLATDGLGQALLLKGYGNEGHDSANSEYADIAEREGGVEEFQKLIQIAHKYNTEVGIHVNAQEIYPEAASFNENMLASGQMNSPSGWGWLDQSYVINKQWDLATQARWKRFVQLYDRINETSYYSNAWPVAVGDSTGEVADQATLKADAATRPDNMDFIYLDVWYQDSWETRQIAKEINSLGWRFTTEFSGTGEYDSTWQHWSTDAKYGGATSKGLNSDIVRFLRNDQRDSQVLNWPEFGGTADNPLLGGFHLGGFEGWGGDQNFDSYIERTYNENLPTRFLQHYIVTKWENYAEGESPVGNHEKQITLMNDDGDVVVVTRKEEQRDDINIERTITLNGKKVLDDVTYLLPWIDAETGELKLYHWNLDGGTTAWELPDDWSGLQNVVVYELTDQGRVNGQSIAVGSGNTITLTAEAATPYLVVKGEEVKTLQDTFGEGGHVVDPGFNAYVPGQSLTAGIWSGDIDDASVTVETAVTGDQNLVMNAPSKDVSVTTQLTGLTVGQTYVAELYVDNESDAKASVTVKSGDETVSGYTLRSIARNYVQCDEQHYASNYDSRMQYLQVYFTAAAETAEFTLSREAGSGITYWDDIRVVDIVLNNYQEDGSFTQDFESVVQGLYPFVLGSAQGVTDPCTHLSQLHAPYTQSGWATRVLDDVIQGEYSVKHHTKSTGIVYQTIPQNFRFEPAKVYKVSFDYQSGPEGAYAMVVGNGTSYSTPAGYLPSTAAAIGGKSTTNHYEMQVIGGGNGQTWIGLYMNASKATSSSALGGYDFILDNLVITQTDDFVIATSSESLYKGETAEIYASDTGATWENSDETVLSFDENTMTVGALKAGTATITATKGEKNSSVTIVVTDSVTATVPYGPDATATANTEELEGEDAPASAAIDGDSGTFWHSNWAKGFTVSESNPAILTIDLGEEALVSGFRFQQRPSGNNGTVQNFKWAVGNDLDALTLSDTVEVPTTSQTNGAWITVNLEENRTIRYIQIAVTKGYGNYAAIAEVEPIVYLTVADTATLADTSIVKGESETMQPEVPAGTVLKGIVWSSSDLSVATVDKNGNVTAIENGETTITMSNAAGLTASCTVTVVDAPAPILKNGLVLDEDGVWRLYKDDVVEIDYTGLTPYEGNWYYVENGVLLFNYTGLAKFGDDWFYCQSSVLQWGYYGFAKYGDSWYYCENSKVNVDYTGLGLYDGIWYYCENGVLNTGYTGLAQYEDGWYYVVNGVLGFDYFGLVQYGDSWYYCENSIFASYYTGMVLHGNAWFYVETGMVHFDYTGLVPYNGTLYYVAGGILDWTFNGTVTYQGKTYTVVNGIAQ